MTRFPQSVGNRGSQKWIQKLVNEKPELLNLQIRRKLGPLENVDVRWLSPLKDDEYAEYCDQDFVDLLGVKLEEIPLANFWPERGPQWDALGKSRSGKLFLVESKSHVPELISKMRAKDEDSVRKIRSVCGY